jgi:hypothetical protein
MLIYGFELHLYRLQSQAETGAEGKIEIEDL